MNVALACKWDGEALVPLHARFADKHLVIGSIYTLVEQQDRSAATHRHYFAAINECWQSLPDAGAERFPTSEALRKYCLIKAGYRDERSIVCASKAEAQRVAGFIKPMDDYAIVTVSEAVVTVYTAKSQSMRAMGKKAFAESKEGVLRVLSELLGVEVGQLPQAEAA